MKRFLGFFVSFLVFSQIMFAFSWETNLEVAKQKAADLNKGVVILFTGSDWCPWCKKLDSQVFRNKNFQELAEDHFVFLMVDFPHKQKNISAKQKEHNASLQREYKVRGFPTVILMHPTEGVIKRTGYLPIDGRKYANILIQLYQNFNQISEKLEKKALKEKELLEMNEQAKEMDSDELSEKIFQKGLTTKGVAFFRLERYKTLLEEHKNNKNLAQSAEVKKLFKELMKIDPNSLQELQYQVAQEQFSNLQKERFLDVSHVVAPLIDYIDSFASKDKTNLWKIHMMVANYYFENKYISQAVQHAEAAHKVAPSNLKKELADTVLYMNGKKVAVSDSIKMKGARSAR